MNLLLVVQVAQIVCNQTTIAPDGAKLQVEDRSAIELLEFVGFSSPETEAAWRMKVRSPAPDGAYIDRYMLASVVDFYSGEIKGTYRLSAVRRTTAQGKVVDLPERLLAASNPRWNDAQPNAVWRKLERQARFRARRLKIMDGALMIEPDRDAKLEIEMNAASILVRATLGSAMGYQPVLRLLNGEATKLGHVRVEGRPGVSHRATIELFYSATGMKAAIVSRVEASGGTGAITTHETVFWPNVVRLPAPVGTIDVAGMKIGAPGSAGTGGDLNKMDPEMRKLYERLLGGQK